MMSPACNIAGPCKQGDHSLSLKNKVKNFYDLFESNHFVKKIIEKSGMDVLPGSLQMCPLPTLPINLTRKPRFKATLKKFYYDFAAYLLLVDKITEKHPDLLSEMKQKVTMPMCDILCLGYTTLGSRKKTQKIARKLRKKYQKFTMNDKNACQIYQPVTMLESLKIYVKSALPKLVGKVTRRTRRQTKKKSKRGRRKGKKRGPGRNNRKGKTRRT